MAAFLSLPRSVGLARVLVGGALVLAAVTAGAVTELVPFQTASPNFPRLFEGVRVGDPVPEPAGFKAGDEILLATYALLSPVSPLAGQAAVSNRLLLLLDHRFGQWNEGQNLEDIGFAWQACYAARLLQHHRPDLLDPVRTAAWASAIEASNLYILQRNPLLYEQGLLAQLWLNGDLRLAMSVYFGSLFQGQAARAELARRTIDEVMCMAALADGGTRYVGFWGEVATYHEENVRLFVWWWKITGSPSIKAALDATVRYSFVANEPSGFTEQSSNIPYKHMYNNLHNRRASLWKAYLYDDGYNYFFGASEETTTSTEPLNAILYQPSRRLLTPPDHVGVFLDGNIQGPRGRFHGRWGWIAHGRDVQRGGPESAVLSEAQGFMGRMIGKQTFVGAFALGPVANKTSLTGALDSVTVEFKQTPGDDPNHMRGARYRFLAQEERTATLVRRGFGALSTRYVISTRTSALAAPNWDGFATAWEGNQLWLLTGERMLGLVQISALQASTVYGLNARLVFTGGRRNIMGAFLPLGQPDAQTFVFGGLQARLHASSFTGPVTSHRIPISDLASTDDFSVLIRLHDAASGQDLPQAYPAGTRRWLLVDVARTDVPLASAVENLAPGDSQWAAFAFTEGARRVRIHHNLGPQARSLATSWAPPAGSGPVSLHRSWSPEVTPLGFGGTPVSYTLEVPGGQHVVVVAGPDPDDHHGGFLTSDDLFGGPGNLVLHAVGERAGGRVPDMDWSWQDNRLSLAFVRRRSDLTYWIDGSADLADWRTVAVNPGLPGARVSVTDPAPAAGGSQFLRLRISRP